MEKVHTILDNNIICTDSNDWNYDDWISKLKYESISLF